MEVWYGTGVDALTLAYPYIFIMMQPSILNYAPLPVTTYMVLCTGKVGERFSLFALFIGAPIPAVIGLNTQN